MQESSFVVTLCDYPQLPDTERARAEARYTRVLERQLGGTDQVTQALALMEGLEDTPPEEVSEQARMLYPRWVKAAKLATEAGLQGLGESETCFFEIKRDWRH